jgi:hypothetical protein
VYNELEAMRMWLNVRKTYNLPEEVRKVTEYLRVANFHAEI